jgi:hypothetical protein
MEGCEACGGELRLLGQLGRMVWLRCRDGGSEQGQLAEVEDFDRDELGEVTY